MYNAVLNRLMKQHGKVKGLKTVCSACKKYAGYEKFMIYYPAYNHVYYIVYNKHDAAGNKPAKLYMEDYITIEVNDCKTMVDLYNRLINRVGDLR